MARILLIETATEVCSAAIAIDGRVLALAETADQPKHAEQLTLLIRDCVREAGLSLSQLDAVALSRGPGSYTSLRIGASVAKGICYALDKPLIALDTLQGLAAASFADCGLPIEAPQSAIRTPQSVIPNPQSAIRNPQSVIALPMLDARRNEVWTAVYDAQLRELLPAQALILEHELFEKFLEKIPGALPNSVFVVSGNGAKKMENAGIFKNAVFSPIQHCSARFFSGAAERLFQDSDFQSLAYFEPHYIKMPNITKPANPPF